MWPLNSTLASYAAHVEVEPTVQMELTAEYDSQSSDFFTQARAGSTRYFRIHAFSTVLAGAATVKYALHRSTSAGRSRRWAGSMTPTVSRL